MVCEVCYKHAQHRKNLKFKDMELSGHTVMLHRAKHGAARADNKELSGYTLMLHKAKHGATRADNNGAVRAYSDAAQSKIRSNQS